MIILNSNETDQVLDTKRYTESLKDKTVGIDVMSGKKYDMKTSVILPKQTALILELK